jgi:glutamate-5-semialdehyde dehydrogenase
MMDGSLRLVAARARAARHQLGCATPEKRSDALFAVDALLTQRRDEILQANAIDVAAARDMGLPPALLDRLGLSTNKLAGLQDGLRQLAHSRDPIDEVLRATELDDGLILTQVRSPIGLLLVIFESRPDAVIQIGSLALRSGNGLLLKGGSEATHSNRILVDCLRAACENVGLDPNVLALVEGRQAVQELLAMDDLIDLVIPRGSNNLVRSIQASTRIPVLGHAEGICHMYLDRAADPIMAARLAVDAKCNYPSACNSIESLLVHRDFLPHLPEVGEALRQAGVELRADEPCRARLPYALIASPDDGATEYGSLILSVRAVDNLDTAIQWIRDHGSAHTESIVTSDLQAAERFLAEVDSASVFHNASTRFADGYRYGLGAEVGISTSRIHARGPVGVEGLTTARWLLRGNGHRVQDYGTGKRAYKHVPLSRGSENPTPRSVVPSDHDDDLPACDAIALRP